jgi:hypothetical protein
MTFFFLAEQENNERKIYSINEYSATPVTLGKPGNEYTI